MYVDDILIISNDVDLLSSMEIFYCLVQFDIKYLEKIDHILRIKLFKIQKLGC